MDGAISECNQVLGTYIHGIFDSSKAAAMIYRWAGAEDIQQLDHLESNERAINRIADAIEEHMDLGRLWPDLNLSDGCGT
jgi:adenosylcobyric acid synthase